MATQTRGPVPPKVARPTRPATRGERTTPARFIREIRQELTKVVWPTRRELITYTTVALIFILIMVAYVTGLDTVFTKMVIAVFG